MEDHTSKGFPGDPGKESACSEGHLGSIPGSEDLLEKEMATHSSVLARITPWTGAWWATVYGVAELDMIEVIEQGCKPHR